MGPDVVIEGVGGVGLVVTTTVSLLIHPIELAAVKKYIVFIEGKTIGLAAEDENPPGLDDQL